MSSATTSRSPDVAQGSQGPAEKEENEAAIGYRSISGWEDKEGWGEPDVDLETRGVVPDWLDGQLYRMGPGVYEVGDLLKIHHWFDGLGVLFRFAIKQGTVKYAWKLVNGGVVRNVKKVGGRGDDFWFGQDLCKGVFGKLMSMWRKGNGGLDSYNISVTVGKFPGKGLVARTDNVVSMEVDPTTLEEKERFTFEMLAGNDEFKGDLAAAHSQYDRSKDELYNFSLQLGPPPGGVYKTMRISPGRVELLAVIKRVPSYIHSFAMTQNYIIMIFWPAQIAPLKVLYEKNILGGLKFNSRAKTAFYIISKSTGRHVATFESPAFFCIHTVNACEKIDSNTGNTSIDIDLCRYDDAEIINSFKMQFLRTMEASFFPKALLTRFTLPDVSEAVTTGAKSIFKAREKTISDASIELPRYNDSRHMQPYRYVYGISSESTTGRFHYNSLVKIDISSGGAIKWSEPHCYTGEPIFVADPTSPDRKEDSGVLLSVVLDATAKASFLLILDARNMKEIGRALVPRVVPFGFHGNFLKSPP